jgi:two-component system, LuxR family, sensor kinase FixL
VTLMESEKLFEALFENSMEAQLLIEDGKFVDCNRNAMAMLGIDRKEKIIGLTPQEISPDLQPDGMLSINKTDFIIKNFCESGSICIEWAHRRFDGICFYLEIYLTAINIQNRALVHVVWRDISQRKLFEKNLTESEERYRTLVNNLNIGVFRTTIDAEGKFISVNPALVELLGFDSEKEMRNHNVVDFYPDKEARFNFINEIVRTGIVTNKEVQLKKKNEDLFIVSITAKAKRESDGITKWIDGVMEDISERKVLERKLINISECERRRIGRDLHDGLGQILTGISIMFGTVAKKLQLKKPVSSAEITQLAGHVENAIESVHRIAMGLCPVSMEKDGLIIALREMADSVEKEYGIHCRLENSAMPFSLDMSATNHLYYIAVEAVTNSIKHGMAKNIKILLTNHGKKFLLIIQDDGKQKKAKKKKNKGMGLEIMKYRADIIGALFSAESHKNGFVVRIEMYL